MKKSFHFIASLNSVSIHGTVNWESESSAYSVVEDKHILPDTFQDHPGVTIFPFFTLDAVVNYYLDLGFTLKLMK